MKNIKIISLASVLVSLLATAPAFAQAVPSSAESSRVEKSLPTIQSPKKAVQPNVTVPDTRASLTAPAGADKIHLTLTGLKVEGMSVYTDADIAPLYADMVGKKITLADAFGIAEKLTAKYRNEGYILSQVVVPPQTIESGTVRLQVVEGFIDAISIQGDVRDGGKQLQKYAQHIKESAPLNSKALEHYVLLMNDIPGLSVRAVLSPSPKVAGASDVMFVVTEQKLYDVNLSADNRGTRYLGPLQLAASTRLNSLLGYNEAINFQVVTAPQHREMDYIGGSIVVPVNSYGTALTLGGNVTSTEPGFELSPFDVQGLSKSVNLGLSHPFIRGRAENLIGTAKLDYLNSERKDNLGGAKIEDRLRVGRLGGTYQFADRFVGINTLGLELSQGFDILQDKPTGSANMTRANGVTDFTKVTMDLSRLQRLSDKFELLATATGQKSANTLLASEEFGVGGASFGSAYDPSEITGEDGIAGKLELRWNDPVQWPGLDGFQLYSYYDIGKVWDRDNAVSKEKRRSIASAGVGFRADLTKHLSGSFEMAQPLTRNVEVEDDTTPRYFLSVGSKF